MELNENAQIDTSQVEDVRGSGGGGARGFGLPIGGGRGGIVGLIIGLIVLLAGGGYGATQIFGGNGSGGGSASDCSTSNPNRFSDTACRNELFINSIQAFWTKELPQVYGQQYVAVKTVFYTQQTETGCGTADSGVGPFYCPTDKLVYIDPTFYDELVNRFGAKGEFPQAYVLAHEYGHHIQDLVGTLGQVERQQQRDPNNAGKLQIPVELQADCYAGVWAKHATETTDEAGNPIFKSITNQDIADAVNAAGAVGDDTIQRKAGQQVNPDTFTHGSAAQREHWFTAGYQSGDPKQCNTFG